MLRKSSQPKKKLSKSKNLFLTYDSSVKSKKINVCVLAYILLVLILVVTKPVQKITHFQFLKLNNSHHWKFIDTKFICMRTNLCLIHEKLPERSVNVFSN